MTHQFEDCDGALWYVDLEKEIDNIDSTIYRYENSKIKPSEDTGFHKYHILTYKQDRSTVEVMSAYIGDVKCFIVNHASAGYHGMMVKHKSISKKSVKEMFTKILTNWKFSDRIIRDVVKQV